MTASLARTCAARERILAIVAAVGMLPRSKCPSEWGRSRREKAEIALGKCWRDCVASGGACGCARVLDWAGAQLELLLAGNCRTSKIDGMIQAQSQVGRRAASIWQSSNQDGN
jgi:uncharacterized membrane protein